MYVPWCVFGCGHVYYALCLTPGHISPALPSRGPHRETPPPPPPPGEPAVYAAVDNSKRPKNQTVRTLIYVHTPCHLHTITYDITSTHHIQSHHTIILNLHQGTAPTHQHSHRPTHLYTSPPSTIL